MPRQPLPIVAAPPTALPVAAADSDTERFEVDLPVFAGPLQLLLSLIESRQLDVLTVPLADLADAYVEHLAHSTVPTSELSEFVAIAAQLILLKSRRLLPGEPLPAPADAEPEADEEQLRRRVLEYRLVRDAAQRLSARDLVAPLWRREPRESDLPEVGIEPMPAALLAESLERLAASPEPATEPPEVMAREVTIGQQIRLLRDRLSASGRLVLQAVLEECRSRAETTVTILALLELVRRRTVHVEQTRLFGPIVIEPASEART